jgi:hypothetical protein
VNGDDRSAVGAERRITPSANPLHWLRLSAFNQPATPEPNGMLDGRAAAPIVPQMLRSAVSAFTRVFDAPSARSRASSTRRQRVHARLRRAMHLRRGALLIRGPTCACRHRSRLCGAARRALHRVRDTSGICARRRQVICPSGGLSTGVSSLISDFPKNISLFTHPKSSLELTSSSPQRGVSRSSRTRGGMRWTRQRWRAMGSQGRFKSL